MTNLEISVLTLSERVVKSPKEVMTGQPHPHWLELLGFTRFQSA